MTNTTTTKPGDVLTIGADAWRVVAVGSRSQAGRIYLHLAHTARGTQGRAGFIPVQECGWFDGVTLHAEPEQ